MRRFQGQAKVKAKVRRTRGRWLQRLYTKRLKMCECKSHWEEKEVYSTVEVTAARARESTVFSVHHNFLFLG